MNSGRIEQFADPATLYARPASPFVMEFVGLSLRLTGDVAGREGAETVVKTALGPVRIAAELPAGPAVIGVRPELVSAVDAGAAPAPGRNRVEVVLEDVAVLGSKTVLHARAPEGDRLICELPGMRPEFARGRKVAFDWAVSDTLGYGAAS